MTGHRRVVITGLGVVSPYGVGLSAFAGGLREGRSAVTALTLFDPGPLACRVAAQVPAEFDPSRYVAPRDLQRVPRVVPMAIAAVGMALQHAGLAPGELDDATRRDLAVILGSGGGGFGFAEEQYRAYFTDDGADEARRLRRVHPYTVSASIPSVVSSEVSIAFGLRGRSHVLSNGCTSSSDALGAGLDLIRMGRARCVVSGGADACITYGTLASYVRMGAVPVHYNDAPERASRPFDAKREGFVFAEGAYVVILEEREAARARGARIWGELRGYGATCEAYHRVAVRDDGIESARAVGLALADAGLPPQGIDYVNLHGTATRLNDPAETRALRRALGARASRIPMSSTKSLIGHPQGASGAAGLVATLCGMDEGWVHPTLNLDHPDPDCDLDYVAHETRRVPVAGAICNCLGFGSKNAALVVTHPDADL